MFRPQDPSGPFSEVNKYLLGVYIYIYIYLLFFVSGVGTLKFSFSLTEKKSEGQGEPLGGRGGPQRRHPCSSLIRDRAVGNDHFCDTTKRASQRLTPHIKGEIALYHRSGDKPLDATTLIRED